MTLTPVSRTSHSLTSPGSAAGAAPTGGNDTTSPYASPADYTWTYRRNRPWCPFDRRDELGRPDEQRHDHPRRRLRRPDGPVGNADGADRSVLRLCVRELHPRGRQRRRAGSGLDVSTRRSRMRPGCSPGTPARASAPMPARSRSPTLRSRPVTATRYSFTIADKVGNVSSARPARPQSSTTVPRLSQSALPPRSPGRATSTTTAAPKTPVLLRSTGSGSFDLNATASDSDTAVDAVDFPTISSLSGWSGSTGGADATSPYSSPTVLLVELRRRGARRADSLCDRQGRELVLGHDNDRRRHERADRTVDHAHRRARPLLRLELGRLQPCQRLGQRRRRRARPRLGHGDTRDRHALG